MGIHVDGRPRAPVSIRSRERVQDIEDGFLAPNDTQPTEEPAGRNDTPLQEPGVPDRPGEESPARPAQDYRLPLGGNPATQHDWAHTERATRVESDWLPPEEDWCWPAGEHPGADVSQQTLRLSSGGSSTRDRRTPPAGSQVPPNKRSRLDSPTGAAKWLPVDPPVVEQEQFEVFDSFIRSPPTAEESVSIQREQELRKRLNLTILPVEISEDQDDGDGLLVFPSNVTRELEEYGFDFGHGQDFADTDDSFSDNLESAESPEMLSALQRLRWVRDRNELNLAQNTSIDATDSSDSEVDDSSDSDPSADMRQQDNSPRSAPGVLPPPKRFRLSLSTVNPTSGDTSSGVSSSVVFAPSAVPVSQTSEEPPRPLGIQERYGDHIIDVPDTSLLLSPSELSHPVVDHELAEARPGWRNYILLEDPLSPNGAACEPDTLPTDRASDADIDELVDVRGTAGDGHQENGASALVDDVTPYSSTSVDFDIWHAPSRTRTPGRSRPLCRSVYFQIAAVISWVAVFICVLTGDYVAAMVLFMLFLVVVAIVACKKCVLPVLLRLCRRSSTPSSAAQDTIVVQPPAQMGDLVETYP